MWIKTDPDGNLYIRTGKAEEMWVWWSDGSGWRHHKKGLGRKGKAKTPPACFMVLAATLNLCEIETAKS